MFKSQSCVAADFGLWGNKILNPDKTASIIQSSYVMNLSLSILHKVPYQHS